MLAHRLTAKSKPFAQNITFETYEHRLEHTPIKHAANQARCKHYSHLKRSPFEQSHGAAFLRRQMGRMQLETERGNQQRESKLEPGLLE